MEPITSTDNSLVKLARSLHEAKGRARQRAFLVEGLRMVEAASAAGAPQIVLHTPDFGSSGERGDALLRRLAAGGAQVRSVTERVFAHVSDTVTPQGIVAVVPLSDGTMRSAAAPALELILDELGDPGNAGTLLRTAAAAGVTRVLSANGTVDLFAPKVVRAAAGAHFSLGLGPARSWSDLLSILLPDVQVVLADASAPRRHWDVDWRRPSALIVSSEARGASDHARRLATERVSIPMEAGVESLNAGVAGSIILYEALRQRTAHGVTV